MKELKKKINYWCRDILEDHMTGKNVTAAILDTGIMAHPDLAGRIVGRKDCVNGKEKIYDDNGHGTHVAGILAGDGRCRNGLYAGIAPGASLVPVKVLNHKGGGRITDVLQGIQYVMRERVRLNIRIVNVSIGTLSHEEDRDDARLLFWVERLWDMGIIVIAAAGNKGPGAGTITIPGVSRKVITVGACDKIHQNELPGGNIQMYSGCGPTKDCVMKPDLSTPGNRIFSCNYAFPMRSSYAYISKSGTSMSTPVVSGAAALLLEKYPDMSNLEVKLRFWNSCDDLGLPESQQGHGQLNIEKLLSV